MSRYWRIYRTFVVSSLVRELEFKANFIAKIIQNTLWISFFVLIVMVVYRNTNSVAGWGRGDALILAATLFLMTGLNSAFFFSLTDIPQQVRLGTLDFVITKPVDSQFWVSMRRFNFDQVGTLLAGALMMLSGFSNAHSYPSPAQWGAYFLLVGCALAMFYSFNLALMTTGIWLVRVDNLWVLGETVTGLARYPLDIFPSVVQRAFTYFLPLAFLATIPARQLLIGVDGKMIGLGLLWAILSLLLSRAFWRLAARQYTSASS